MIVSARPMTLTPRWAQAFVLLIAAVLLPLGVAHAQEPDYEAVGDRLLEAVEEGELSADQAEAMMGELARVRFKQRLEALRVEDEGDEDGEDAWEGIAKSFERLGMPRARFEGLCERLAEGGLEKHQFVPALGATLKLVHMLRDSGGKISKEDSRGFIDYFEEHDLSQKQIKMLWAVAERFAAHLRKTQGPDRVEMGKVKEKIWGAVKAGKLTEEEAKQKWEAYLSRVRGGANGDDSLVGRYEKLGVDIETLGKVKAALLEAGVKKEQIEGTLGGMLRAIHQAKEQGEKFELHPGLRDYFLERVKLTEEQVDVAVRLSRRLAYSAKRGTKQY